MALTRTRTLVTGGAGVLGSHLCDRLIERGDTVVCLDDLSTGTRENVAHLQGHDRFSLVVTDVSELHRRRQLKAVVEGTNERDQPGGEQYPVPQLMLLAVTGG